MKIAIVVPSNDMVHADFALSLVNLVAYETTRGENQLAVINPRSSLVQKGRHDGVMQALKMGAEKVLFIDSDQKFPPDGLERLLAHDRLFVGATCRRRRSPHYYTAKSNLLKLTTTLEGLEGLMKVDSNGFPFCLIDCSIFEELLKETDELFKVSKFGDTWYSEDENFCHTAKLKLSQQVYVDIDLSKEIGHIGTKVY